MLLFQAKGAKSQNGMWRPDKRLVVSNRKHGSTWFAPSKSPQVQRVTKVESPLAGNMPCTSLLDREALFASIFFWCFLWTFFWEILNVRWSYSQDSDQISLLSGKELQIPSGWNLLHLLKQGLSGRDQPRNDWNMETWKAHGLSKNGIFGVSTWWTWKRQLDFRLRPPYFANFFKTNFVEPLWVIWWSSLARDG